jgi:hypothetical protein
MPLNPDFDNPMHKAANSANKSCDVIRSEPSADRRDRQAQSAGFNLAAPASWCGGKKLPPKEIHQKKSWQAHGHGYDCG